MPKADFIEVDENANHMDMEVIGAPLPPFPLLLEKNDSGLERAGSE